MEVINSNELLFDNKDCHDWPIHSIREAISYVPQTPFLFSQSISDNIAFTNHLMPIPLQTQSIR